MITSTRTIPFTRLIATGAAVVALATLGVACGDSDADVEGSVDTTEAPSPTAAGSLDDVPKMDLDPAACSVWVDLHAALVTAPEDPAALEGFATALATITGSLAGEVPDELADDAEVLTEAAATVAAEGSPESLFAPEAMAAMTAIGGAAHEGCDLQRIDLIGADYSFDGLDGSLPAGPTSFRFANEGTEEHEMILLRRNPDSDAELAELLEEDPDALFAEATMAGVVFAAPDETAFTAVDLEPGEHLAVCTIPTGGEEGGEPHHAHGMVQAFTVT